MVKLLPDQLRDVWVLVDRGVLTSEQAAENEERLLEDARDRWRRALVMPVYGGLTESLLREVALYLGRDVSDVRRRCECAADDLGEVWRASVDVSDRESVYHFYEDTKYIYDLIWWHTLQCDNAPLAYVAALQLAEDEGHRTYLDFGAGVGSGGILFARNDFSVTVSDISSTLLDFTRWRFEQRKLDCRIVNLTRSGLPAEQFDLITAMDVFEHLVDPAAAIDTICDALRPGGIVFGRFAAEDQAPDSHPQHIVHDMSEAITRMEELGLVEVWKDEWLWGHQAFQKI